MLCMCMNTLANNYNNTSVIKPMFFVLKDCTALPAKFISAGDREGSRVQTETDRLADRDG